MSHVGNRNADRPPAQPPKTHTGGKLEFGTRGGASDLGTIRPMPISENLDFKRT